MYISGPWVVFQVLLLCLVAGLQAILRTYLTCQRQAQLQVQVQLPAEMFGVSDFWL